MGVKKTIHQRGWMPSAFAIALGIAFQLLPLQAMAGEIRGCAKDNGKFRIVEDGEFCTGDETELRFSTYQPLSESQTASKPAVGGSVAFFNMFIANGISPRGFCNSDGTMKLDLINSSGGPIQYVITHGGGAPELKTAASGSFFFGSSSTPVDQIRWSMVVNGKEVEVFGAGFVDSSTDTCTFIVQATVGE